MSKPQEQLPDMIASDLLLESPVSGAGPTVSSVPSYFCSREVCKASNLQKIANFWNHLEDPRPLYRALFISDDRLSSLLSGGYSSLGRGASLSQQDTSSLLPQVSKRPPSLALLA